MSDQPNRLYDLLPRYIRYRDAYEGRPLEILMDALEIPRQAIEHDIDEMYRAWFIETCAEDLVPYLAELLGVRGLDRPGAMFPSQRARVADTLAARRLKGTVAALEHMAATATGWGCHAVESRRLVLTTPSMRHPGIGGGDLARRGVDLRRVEDLERLGSPFEAIGHTVDLRLPPPPPAEASGRSAAPPATGGRRLYHPEGLELCFWRRKALPVRDGTPRFMRLPERPQDRRCFTIHPTGRDMCLFHLARTPNAAFERSNPDELSMPLEPAHLAREIYARRRGLPPPTDAFGRRPVLRIRVDENGDGRFRTVAPAALEICDLSNWRRPRPVLATSGHDTPPEVAVDPARGRLSFYRPSPVRRVRVDYAYAVAAELGGGPYRRFTAVPEAAWQTAIQADFRPLLAPLLGLLWALPDLPDNILAALYVLTAAARDLQARRHHSFARALRHFAAWLGDEPSGGAKRPKKALIRFVDNGHYAVQGLVIDLPPGVHLTLRAEDGRHPLLLGHLKVRGQKGSQLSLEGLWIEGTVSIEGQASLVIEHCTIAPARRGEAPRVALASSDYQTDAAYRHFEVRIRHSLLMGLRLPRRRLSLLEISDSVIDGDGGPAICGLGEAGDKASDKTGDEPAAKTTAHPVGPPAQIERSTLLGEVVLYQLWRAENVLFADRLTVARPREGRMRYCFTPQGSITPLERHCLQSPAPVFASTVLGEPDYAALHETSGALLTAGENGNEIGAHHGLRQSDRLANLKEVLAEFLPSGYGARVRLIT